MAGRRRTNKTAQANTGRAWGVNETNKRVVRAKDQQGASATKLPPSQDTAFKLLGDLKAHRLDPRDMTTDQRRACVMLLANGTQTSTELAVLFKVTASSIRMDLKKIRETMGREVRNWSLEEVLGQLALAADKASAAAMKQEDPGLMWTVQRDFAKLLIDLGIVGKPQEQDSFKVTIEALGQGYERATKVLARGLDPRLTGEVVDVSPGHPRASIPMLPLPKRLEGTVPQNGGAVPPVAPQDSSTT